MPGDSHFTGETGKHRATEQKRMVAGVRTHTRQAKRTRGRERQKGTQQAEAAARPRPGGPRTEREFVDLLRRLLRAQGSPSTSVRPCPVPQSLSPAVASKVKSSPRGAPLFLTLPILAVSLSSKSQNTRFWPSKVVQVSNFLHYKASS